MKGLGILLLVVAAAAFLFGFIMDTSVASVGGRVHNLGLMSLKQNVFIFAGVLAIVGAILVGFGRAPADPETRFMNAIRNKDVATVSSMLESKAISPNGRMPTGRGWLQYAVALGNRAVAECLLEAGANPELRDGFQRTALQEAESAQTDIRDLLRNWKAPELGSSSASGGSMPRKSASESNDVVAQLEALAELHRGGALTIAEFETAKSRVLGR